VIRQSYRPDTARPPRQSWKVPKILALTWSCWASSLPSTTWVQQRTWATQLHTRLLWVQAALSLRWETELAGDLISTKGCECRAGVGLRLA